MKNTIKTLLITLILIIISSIGVCAEDDIRIYTKYDNFGTINMQTVEGKNYMFLPSFVKPSEFRLYFEYDYAEIIVDGRCEVLKSGEAIDLYNFAKENNDNEFFLKLFIDSELIDLNILKSDNVSSISIESEKGIDFLNETKKNKLSGRLSMIDKNGNVVYDDKLKEIKGRGNSTWENSEKKPYQFKLEKEENLLNDGNEKNVDKTWILLTNSFDPTMLRNKFSYDLAHEIGMDFSPECIPVDLYFNSEYIGAYLLCEKVEISSGRIDIHNLEDDIDALNEGVNTEINYGTNKYGNKIKYSSGLIMPENYKTGFLLEYEYEDRVDDEDCWFATSNGNYVVIKSPENLPEDVVIKISEYYQEYEDALYNDGINSENGKNYKEYIDFESLLKLFTIEQFSKDVDTFMASTFMYLDDDYKFNFGTVWDFDIAYGIGSNEFIDDNQKTSGFSVFNTKISEKLLEIDSFKSSFIEYYNNEFSKIISGVLSDNYKGDYLHSLDFYANNIYMSQKMNNVIWEYAGYSGMNNPWIFDNYFENVNYLKTFISNRNQWILESINNYKALDWISKINIYTYYDESENDIYVSLGESDYYVAKIVSADFNNIIIKHLSGLKYSDSLKIYINNVKTDYTKGEFNTVIIKTPEQHLIMPPKKENIVFKDVENTSWYYDYVYNVYNNGWMKGVTEKRFQPDGELKKGMVVTALYRLLESDNSKIKFTISSECYNNSADWAVKSNIIPVQENDYIYLSNMITRQEAALLFYKSSNCPKTSFDLNYTDTENIAPFYYDAIKWCAENKILEGDNKNRILPNKYLTRAEFTKMLSVYGKILNK